MDDDDSDVRAMLRSAHNTVVPPRRPLGLDKMFSRAQRWKTAGPLAPARTPSPVAGPAHLTLPTPLFGTDVSPLAGLFTYPELVPAVLEQLQRPDELAVAARVCSQWSRITRRRMYRDIWASPKRKLLRLFETLSTHPDLCEAVRSLDIRFFPLDMKGESRTELEDMILSSLARMVNLTKLVWTRDRSISSEVFAVIIALPRLEYLEISGHSTRMFDATLLGQMRALQDLRIMMPDAAFRSSLPLIAAALDARVNGGLRGLALVCRDFTFINDALLRQLAPHLTHLRRLQVVGNTKVTREGVYDVLEVAPALEQLVLDAPPHSDLVNLSDAPRTPALHTFSLSFPSPRHTQLGAADMPTLRRTDSLRALELNLSTTHRGDQKHRVLPMTALEALQVQVDFGSLTRLALLNMVVDADVLSSILAHSPLLEELYICIGPESTLFECAPLQTAPLRILHANAPEIGVLRRETLAKLAAALPCLEEIGSMNRVYEVHRWYEGDDKVVQLAKWSQITTPGYFQVWRP